jgi:uncharacterized protein YdgA (DUF945 family)
LLVFYNSQEGIHIEVKKYERHWFSAEAELKVKLDPSWVTQISQSLVSQGVSFPASVEFNVVQHIQNGPILYHRGKDESLSVELAYMYSEVQFSPELAQVVELINVYQPALVIVDNLSFSGRFQRSFRSAGFRLQLPGSGNKIEWRGLNADICIWPTQRRIKADINTSDFIVITPYVELTIPQLLLACDRTQSVHKIWVGTSRIAVPRVFLRDNEQASLTIVNLDTSGVLSESGDMLNGERVFTLDKIESGKQVVGSVKLRARMQNFDAVMSAKIISSYGQMLFSDQYMLALAQVFGSLPQVVNNQSSIDLNELEIGTPNGRMQLNGKIDWPGLNTDSRLTDVVQHTQAQGLLRVAIPLANRLAQAVVDLSYPDQPVIDQPQEVTQKRISDAERQNHLVIAMLMESHQLPANASENLIKQQKNHASLDDYQLVLDSMVASKQITPQVAETLRAKYASIQVVNMGQDEKRANALKLLQKRIERWVTNGFISEDKTDYVSNITFKNGQLLINEKPIKQIY